ncbi:MAG: shikimate kinase [Myxococcota bacterium]|nr:shikimate kinase [Myxococcota bacterium]
MDGYYDPHPRFYLERSVLLVGHPGSGVAAVGHDLAARTGLPHTEIARWCEADAGMSLARIAVEAGVPELRRLEARALDRSLARRPYGFISVGSGALEPGQIRSRVSEACCVVFVSHPSAALLERLRLERARAPGGLAEFALGIPGSVEVLDRWIEGRRAVEADAEVLLEGGGRHPCRVAADLLDSLGSLAGSTPAPLHAAP